MKERPILFSTPMVRSVLDGKKTQTRRVIKPQPSLINDNTHFNFKKEYYLTKEQLINLNPYGKSGDLLWVREAHSIFRQGGGSLQREKTKYRADRVWDGNTLVKWKPSIFMPKDAARIWVQIIRIGVERIQSIKEADIKEEGVRIPVNGKKVVFELSDNKAIHFLPPNKEFKSNNYTQPELMLAHWAELWCDVNDRESWEANPWVWVVEFKVISTTGKPSEINL